MDSGDGLETSRVPRRRGCPQLWIVLWTKLSTVLHTCVHRCGRMTSLCFPSFHRGRRTCGKLFEEVGRPSPSYPQPVVHSRLPACSQSVVHSVGPPRTVTDPTAAGGWRNRASKSRVTTTDPPRPGTGQGPAVVEGLVGPDPTAAGGGPLRSAGDPVVRGRRDGRVQNVATLVGGPAVRVNGEKASGAMRRRTGMRAPAVGRGFAGMRCGAQGGRSVWAFRRRSRSKDSAGMRGRVWTFYFYRRLYDLCVYRV